MVVIVIVFVVVVVVVVVIIICILFGLRWLFAVFPGGASWWAATPLSPMGTAASGLLQAFSTT